MWWCPAGGVRERDEVRALERPGVDALVIGPWVVKQGLADVCEYSGVMRAERRLTGRRGARRMVRMRARSLLLVVIGGIALAAPAASSSAAATAPVAIGPPDGVVHALGVASSDPGRAYASGDGGLARSDDGGASWTWVGAAGIAPDGVIAVSPDDEDDADRPRPSGHRAQR